MMRSQKWEHEREMSVIQVESEFGSEDGDRNVVEFSKDEEGEWIAILPLAMD